MTNAYNDFGLGQQTTVFHYDNLCPYEYDRVVIV